MRIRTRYLHPGLPVVAASARTSAFSLVEILVVIAIIGILLAVVFKGGTALIGSSKSRETAALLKKLDLAIDEYKREVDTSRIPNAKYIFNGSPPDDLRAFVASQVVIGGCPLKMRNTGSFPGISSTDALLDTRNPDGSLDTSVPRVYGDIRAMVLAMRLYSPKAKAILDSIDPKYWAMPDEDFVFLPSPGDPNTRIRLDYLVDGWGVPLEYYSTCLCVKADSPGLKPREIVSNAFVHENNDGGVVVSYGPNGPEQFASDMMGAEGDSSMVADYYAEMKDDPVRKKGVLNHRLNSDNLYSSDFFTNRIRQAGP